MFLSIITPFYNNFDDVMQCIAFLEKQTCKDFELILVDDCSTEISITEMDALIFSKEFAVNIIHNCQNSGPGFSRNEGIENACGEYILFLDSDDWLSENTVELLKKLVIDEAYDCILFDYYLVKNKNISASTMFKMKQGIVSAKEAILFSSGSVCCKVYRLAILKQSDIRFPAIYIKEDMVFNKKALYHCKNIYYLQKKLYHYRIHPGSLMHSERACEVKNDIIAFNELKDTFKRESDILECLFVKELLYAGVLNMLCSRTSIRDIKSNLQGWLAQFPDWHRNWYLGELPIRMRVFLWALQKNQWWILEIMTFFKKYHQKLRNKK